MSQSFIGPGTGNRIYLVCTHCGKDPIELGRRRGEMVTPLFGKAVKTALLEEWFMAHAHQLAEGPDHFKLAYASTPNHDVPIAADPVANAVRLQLVKDNSNA